MHRLISFFHEPHEDWPDPAGAEARATQDDGDAAALQPEPQEPIYFAELMAYVRQRNARFRWPREGAD